MHLPLILQIPLYVFLVVGSGLGLFMPIYIVSLFSDGISESKGVQPVVDCPETDLPQAIFLKQIVC